MSSINWANFLIVFVASLLGAGTVVLCFAGAIRLFATPPHPARAGAAGADAQRADARGADARAAADAGGAQSEGGGAQAVRDEELDDVGDPTRPPLATAGGIVLFALSGLAVLFGIYLIVPYFSG